MPCLDEAPALLAVAAGLVSVCDCGGSLDPRQLPRLAEVEVACLPRTGKSKVTGTVRGSVRTVRDMSRVLAR